MGWLKNVAAMAAIVFSLAAAAVGADGFAGSYSWNETAAQKEALKKAIDDAVKPMNFAIRGIARGRLSDTTKPYTAIKIEVKGDEITFERNGANPIKAKTDGKEVDWKREDGKLYKVAFSIEADGTLRQTFTAEDGVRENRYTLSADGKTLTMKASLTSKKLKAPLTFTLEYPRQEPKKP